MEAIIKAGGVGYNVKDTAGVHPFPTDQNLNGRTEDIHELQCCKYEATETRLDSSNNKKTLPFCSNDGPKIISNLQCSKREKRFKFPEHQEGQEKRKHKEEKNYGHRSASIFGTHATLHDQFSDSTEQGDTTADKSRFQK